jgi:hypothetical protein
MGGGDPFFEPCSEFRLQLFQWAAICAFLYPAQGILGPSETLRFPRFHIGRRSGHLRSRCAGALHDGSEFVEKPWLVCRHVLYLSY